MEHPIPSYKCIPVLHFFFFSFYTLSPIPLCSSICFLIHLPLQIFCGPIRSLQLPPAIQAMDLLHWNSQHLNIPRTLISHPFWRYSDPYSSPYFVPSQEPAFRPISYLRTCFGSQDAVSDPSPPAHYFRISGLPLVLFPLAPPTRRRNHPISTLSLTRGFRAPTPLFNPDV